MCHQQKDPLRSLSVADGHPKTLAARLAGRTSGDAVAHLIARFNTEGLPEQAYTLAEQEGLPVWTQDEAGPYQTIPYPGCHWQKDGRTKETAP